MIESHVSRYHDKIATAMVMIFETSFLERIGWEVSGQGNLHPPSRPPIFNFLRIIRILINLACMIHDMEIESWSENVALTRFTFLSEIRARCVGGEKREVNLLNVRHISIE